MYSWAGPGSSWVRQPDLPDSVKYHTMTYDKANKAIWTSAGRIGTAYYRYSVESRKWQAKALPYTTYYTNGVLCNNGKFIIIPGGKANPSGYFEPTAMIQLMDISTEQTIIANTTLPRGIDGHVAACISLNL